MHHVDPHGDPVAALFAARDWSTTPLGPTSRWDDTLLAAVDLLTHTRFPASLFWGPDLVLVYNEAYAPMIADKHPAALGSKARDVFPEVWDLIGPMLEDVLGGGPSSWVENQYVPLHRRGFLEECYFTFSYSGVRAPDGTVEGVIDIVNETTGQVVSSRRLSLLSELTQALVDVDRLEDVTTTALAVLRRATRDFVSVDIARLAQVAGSGEHAVGDARGHVATVAIDASTGPDSCFLLTRLSPQLAPDDDYVGFLRLVAATLRQARDRVRTRTSERLVAEFERSMSEALQRALLPEPRLTGYPQISVGYLPAAEQAQIGGDWYDLFELPDGTTMVAVGDVAGHDQAAAAAMAQARNMLRGVAFTLAPAPPSRILAALDRAMSVSESGLIATAVLARVTHDGTAPPLLEWSNAGHPPPLLLAGDGSVRLLQRDPNILLGLDSSPREDHCLALPQGSTIVLYTDGLVERRHADLTDGLSWLQDTLRDQQHLSVDDLTALLLSQVEDAEDDVALLILRT